MAAVRRRRGSTTTSSPPDEHDDDDALLPLQPSSSSRSSSHHRTKIKQQQQQLQQQQLPRKKKRPRKQQQQRRRHAFLFQFILQSLHPRTRQAVMILVVAMLTGILWNWWDNNYINNNEQEDADPTVQSLLQTLCQTSTTTSFYCHPSLIPTARTQKATQLIQAGQVVLKVPRQYQIWDLDAFVDNPIVRQELVHARIQRRRRQQQQQQQHSSSSISHQDDYDDNEPLPSAAFLAAHLALLLLLLTEEKTQNHNVSTTSDDDNDKYRHAYYNDQIWQSYWNVLPTFEQYQQFHPLVWSQQELEEELLLLGGGGATLSKSYSLYAYTHVMSFRQLLQDEYRALTEASATFKRLVSPTDYFTARLHVMTRSFGTGPLDTTITNNNNNDNSDTMQAYADAAGISLDHGFHAMVPILDLYNHHANPNVGFRYDNTQQQQAFVITAITDIAPGDHIRDSYGKRTDADLFARYGFVNGDGSDWTQASLALWHTVQIQHPEQQQHQQQQQQPLRKSWSRKERSLIARYLQYDDGYEHCVGPPPLNKIHETDDEYAKQAWQLKQLKYQYLLSIAAADESRWVFHMSPRAKDARPDSSYQDNNSIKKRNNTTQQQLPPALDLHTIQFDGNAIFGTCRLLTLTHDDYHGNATGMLKAALQSELDNVASSSSKHSKAYHWLPPTQDALEYRTLLCVARMAATALQQFGMSIAQQQQLINTMSVGSKHWIVAHVRLGEMQSLDMLKQVAFAGLRHTFGEDALNINDDYAYRMRDHPCPPNFLRSLVEGTTE